MGGAKFKPGTGRSGWERVTGIPKPARQGIPAEWHHPTRLPAMLPPLGWQGWAQRPEKGSCWTPPSQVNQSQKLSDAPPNSHVPAAISRPYLALFQDTLFQGLKWRRKKGWSSWGAAPRTRDPGWEGDAQMASPQQSLWHRSCWGGCSRLRKWFYQHDGNSEEDGAVGAEVPARCRPLSRISVEPWPASLCHAGFLRDAAPGNGSDLPVHHSG